MRPRQRRVEAPRRERPPSSDSRSRDRAACRTQAEQSLSAAPAAAPAESTLDTTLCQPSEAVTPSAAQSDETIHLLEWFSGSPRSWSMVDAVRRCGGTAIGRDVLLGDDILCDATFQADLALLRSGRVRNLWLGAPCVSYTAMWAWNKHHPFRSRRQPDGLVPMPREWAAYVAKHNAITARVVELAFAQWSAGGTFFIENPADQGMPGGSCYRRAARGSVPIWITSWIRWLCSATQPYWATTDLCRWFSPYRKPTTLCASGPGAHFVLATNAARCYHPTHALRVTDVDADGNPLSRQAGEYPPLFAAYWAFVFTGGTPPPIFAISTARAAARFIARVSRRGGEAPEAPLSASTAETAPSEAELEAIAAAANAPPLPVPPPANPSPEPSWRAAPEAMPAHWQEAADVRGEAYETVRREPLAYLSRRRAEPEAASVLAARPMPRPSIAPVAPERTTYQRMQWPVGSPPRPVRAEQLWLDGVYDEILDAIDTVATSCADGAAGRTMRHLDARVFRAELMAPFARALVEAGGAWDQTDPADVKPLQPFDESDPPPKSVNHQFFQQWAERLGWTDKDMIRQVAVTGVESRSACTAATIVMGHHGGLRANFGAAEAAISADVEAGFVRRGRRDPWVVPSVMVARNCVERKQWKLVDGELRRVVKYRVTTDDSISADGETSRNDGIDRDDWERAGLPGPRTLGEAVAIVKAVATEMGIQASPAALERIALWALDLSHAYRMLAVQRREWGQQCYVWYDGVRLDLRCLFGTAHMVEFFERVSFFVLAVAQRRIAEYDAQHPYNSARSAWARWREALLGSEGAKCAESYIYLDDGHGFTCLDPGEELDGGNPDVPVRASVHVEPGGRVSMMMFACASRPRVHLDIVRRTFVEAGWGIAADKVQLGWSIDSLGFTVCAEGDGCMHMPEAKRLGMIEDVGAQRVAPGESKRVLHADVDTLTGRCLHTAIVACEAAPYLTPMYRMKKARVAVNRAGSRVRVTPKWVTVAGTEHGAAAEYQVALDWWRHALESNVSAPLAPRLHFPDIGEPGVAYQFSDAARERNTGYGGFTTVVVAAEQPRMLYIDERWGHRVQQLLHTNVLSMPAGEGIGAVALADAIATRLPGLTHLVVFSDSSPVVAAINSNNSDSPQLNYIIRWLLERWPQLQLLGIHQPGRRNGASDGISRHATDDVLRAARAAGLHTERLPAAHVLPDLIDRATALPQRAAVPAASQAK